MMSIPVAESSEWFDFGEPSPTKPILTMAA